MEVLWCFLVFVVEIMDVFDCLFIDKELVVQVKVLGWEYVYVWLLCVGFFWSVFECVVFVLGCLVEVCVVFLCLGDELEMIWFSVYCNVVCQLYIFLQFEFVVIDVFLVVVGYIFFVGIMWGKVVFLYVVVVGLVVDCVRQVQFVMVYVFVDCLGEFVCKILVIWLWRCGGWIDVFKCVVSIDFGFCFYWLVVVFCSFGCFLKVVFFVLLLER